MQSNYDYYATKDIKVIYVASLLEGNALALITPRMDKDYACYYQIVKELLGYLVELYADLNRAKNARSEFKKLYMKKD